MRKSIFLFLLFPVLCFSQGEANYWYFGHNAGITFNTSPPTALTNGQLNTNEGCSSISDASGNLLFYTDGRTIWNRNHQVMQNADYYSGTGLLGDPSSTSSGLIVPHPTKPNLYYVFTVDEPHHENAAAYPNQGPANPSGIYSDTGESVPEADDGYNNGLNYSIVDMTLNNGLGNVVLGARNHHLITYNPKDSEEIKYKCSEKITAVKGADCNSIWVLTHFINKFYAFKIDANGIDPDPVISTLAPIIPLDAYRRSALGYMKISPNGKKIVLANNTKTFNPGGSDGLDGGVYLFNFNDVTGKVTNSVALIENVNAYGVEFSMESSKVYATTSTNQGLSLFQWNLESQDIPASRYAFSGVTGNTPTALQLGPNGKIYRAMIGNSKLAVINHPELSEAAADYSENVNNGAIDLQGRTATFGLPPFIQSIFSSRINIVDAAEEIKTELNLCDGESAILAYEDIPNATYTWYLNGTELPNETTSTLPISQPVGVVLPYSEKYKLVLDLNDGSCPLIGIANVMYFPFPSINDAVLEQCISYGTESGTFDLNQAKTQLLNGLNEAKHTVIFYPSLAQAQNGAGAIPSPSTYKNNVNPEILGVRVVHNESGCYRISELKLIVQKIDDLGKNLHLFYCMEQFPEKITLSTNIPQNRTSEYAFLWKPNQETTPTIQVNQAGTYEVTVTKLNTGCSDTRTIEVVASNIATFNLEQIDATENNSITVTLSEGSLGDYEYALDNRYGPYQNSTVFAPVSPGIHTVYARDKNGCGISKKEIAVLGIMKFFTPNNDGINDRWTLIGTSNGYQGNAKLFIFDRYGKLLKTTFGKSVGWDGTYRGKRMPSSDYWYRIVLEDGRTLQGHFTLKR